MKLLPEKIQDLTEDIKTFEPFVLVEIPEESIYLSNARNIIIGQTYYEDLIDDIAPLDQSIKASFGCGYAEMADITIIINNLEKFSDYLIDPENRNFKNKYLQVRLLLDKVDLKYENSIIVFRGVIRDYNLNRKEFTFYIDDAIVKKHKDLPENTIDTWDKATDNLSALIPTAVYGDFREGFIYGYDWTLGIKAVWGGFDLTEQKNYFKICDHEIKSIDYGLYWIPQFVSYIRKEYTAELFSESAFYVMLLGNRLIGHCGHRPSAIGGSNTAGNPENSFDKDFNSYAQLTTANNLLDVDFSQLPFLSDLVESGPYAAFFYARAHATNAPIGILIVLSDSNDNVRATLAFSEGDGLITKSTSISTPATADMNDWYVSGYILGPVGLETARIYEVWVVINGYLAKFAIDFNIQVQGQPDDANGLITGTANLLIEKQLQVIEGVLRNQLSLVDLYYGTDGQTLPWEFDYDINTIALWHLDFGAGDVIDSTPNQCHGTNVGCEREETGIIKNAFRFVRVNNDYIDILSSDLNNIWNSSNIGDEGCYEFWFKAASDFWGDTNQYLFIALGIEIATIFFSYISMDKTTTANELRFQRFTRESGNVDTRTQNLIIDVSGLSLGTDWHHFRINWQINYLEIFIDNVLKGTSGNLGYPWRTDKSLTYAKIGSSRLGTANIDGWLDEIRLSNILRTTFDFYKQFKSSAITFDNIKPGNILYVHDENSQKVEHIINQQLISGTILIEDTFSGAPETGLTFQVDQDIANKSIDELTDAYELAGQLYKLEYSWKFLDRLAKQSFLRIFEDYLGRTKVNRYNASASSLMSFDKDNYKYETLKIFLTPLSQIRNVFRFNYYKNYATERFTKVYEFNPENDATCLASANKYGRSRVFKLDCDYIFDSSTITFIAESYRDYFTERYWIIKFTTWLNAISLEIGDVIDMTDDLLNWSEEKFEVIGFRLYFDSGEIEVTARSLSSV